MTRRLLAACVACIALAFCLSGCGGDPEIPEGYSEKDLRQPTEGSAKSPSAGIEEPQKAGG